MNNQCGNCYLPRHLCKCRPVSQEDCEKAGEKPEAKPESFPRRMCLEKMTPAEKAIFDAAQLVDALPADTRLTKAVVLLQEARDRVADYFDGIGERVSPSTPPTRQMILEEIRRDPGTTLYGIPMPEVTRIIIEHQQRQRTTPSTADLEREAREFLFKHGPNVSIDLVPGIMALFLRSKLQSIAAKIRAGKYARKDIPDYEHFNSELEWAAGIIEGFVRERDKR